jgi:hypothetical protein
MICVIGSFPSEQNQKDGMIQRVAHIDALMAATPRCYLDLSFRRFLRKQVRIQGAATIYYLNVFVHFLLILRLLRTARVVYVHSAYNALRIMAFPTKAYMIFDAHGIVPEELVAEGRSRAARILTSAERFILKRCDALICVTHSMLEHFYRKRGRRADRAEIVLPILPHLGDSTTAAQALLAKRSPESVIYAGGMQAWQNVDKMVEAANQQPRFQYTFLTGDVTSFQARLRESGLKQFTCQSVAPVQVKDFYLSHQYGFVLRDEILVNLVACPTKLVEYLYWGVLPIVITPRIGDFDAESLRGITLTQFLSGELPDTETAETMRRHNQVTVQAMIASAQANQDRLQQLLHAPGKRRPATRQISSHE